ncbi:MAG: AAA family ATPase [Caldilineaceae bacterium]
MPQIGLAHGRMRAGPYGSATRRTYGVQGAAVNPAARLMMQAEPGDRGRGGDRHCWRSGGLRSRPRHSSRSAHSCRARSIVGATHVTSRLDVQTFDVRALIGRDQELSLLQKTLADVCATGAAKLVTVTGDAGMGKKFAAGCVAGRSAVMCVAMSGGQHRAAHSLFRRAPPLRTLLDVDTADAAADIAAQVHAGDCAGTGLVCGASRPRRPADVPIPTMPPPRPWTRLRREALHDLVAGIVVAQTRRTPLVLAVDDAQWLMRPRGR